MRYDHAQMRPDQPDPTEKSVIAEGANHVRHDQRQQHQLIDDAAPHEAMADPARCTCCYGSSAAGRLPNAAPRRDSNASRDHVAAAFTLDANCSRLPRLAAGPRTIRQSPARSVDSGNGLNSIRPPAR